MATPKPICWNETRSPAAKPAKTTMMMSAAPVISRAVDPTPNTMAFGCVARAGVALADPAQQEDLVVHRQAELQSSYLGHPDADESIASHLQLGPDLSPRTWAETHPADRLPVSEARSRCLYDHLFELQQLLGYASGGEITVELADQALELIDTA